MLRAVQVAARGVGSARIVASCQSWMTACYRDDSEIAPGHNREGTEHGGTVPLPA